MKCSIKKVLAVIISAVMIISSMCVPALALEYGAEWGGYTEPTSQKYSDVPSSHWAFDAINRASSKNWFNGYLDGTFRPNDSITRAEALKVFTVFFFAVFFYFYII